MKVTKKKVNSQASGGTPSRIPDQQVPPTVDPEMDMRDWRYSWEKPWRPCLTVR
jgi:hypothetical protein